MPLNIPAVRAGVTIPERRPAGRTGRIDRDTNPMLVYIDRSHANANPEGRGEGFAFDDIPSTDAREFVLALRYAADLRGLGLRLIMTTTVDGEDKTLILGRLADGLNIVYQDATDTVYTGPLTITFGTQPRQKRTPKPGPADGESAETTESDVVESAETTDSDVPAETTDGDVVESPSAGPESDVPVETTDSDVPVETVVSPRRTGRRRS